MHNRFCWEFFILGPVTTFIFSLTKMKPNPKLYISSTINIHWRISIKEHIWCYWHFLIKSIFKAVYYWNDVQFLTARHYSNSQNLVISFEYSWFLAKNLSNFVSLPWKLHNRKCHTRHVCLATHMISPIILKVGKTGALGHWSKLICSV